MLRVRYLTAERLINAANPDFRILVLAALQTGARYKFPPHLIGGMVPRRAHIQGKLGQWLEAFYVCGQNTPLGDRPLLVRSWPFL
jgi:hypothetical protein